MATYKWNRYNINTSLPNFQYSDDASIRFNTLYKNITWDGSQWNPVSPYGATESISVGAVGYKLALGPGNIIKYVSKAKGDASDTLPHSAYYAPKTSNGGQSRGSSAGTVTSTSRSAYPDNGISGSYWYVYAGVVNSAPTTPGAFTSPTGELKGGQDITVTWGASSDAQGDTITYYPEYRYYKNGVAQAWTGLANNTSRSRALTLSTDTTLDKIEFRVRASDGSLYSGYRNSEVFTIEHNTAPTVTLNTENNKTLYENDTLPIDGTVLDTDAGNTVTVRYQINATTVQAIKAFLSDGTTQSFGKQLTFKGGSLYDGDSLIASDLTDGVAHTLKVYATDDKGGQSPIAERTFYVVPNRAPSLTVNPPSTIGNIDNDEIEFTGSYNDLDNNTSTVSYRINGGNSVQVAQGTSGDFDFKIKLGQLKIGLNNIVVEVIDSYGAKTSRTVKFQKSEVKTEQLKSTARYKIKPPLNTAKGVVVWVQRDANLALSASISMQNSGEAENFVPMTKSNTAPLPNQPGIVEDQFQFENETAVNSVILQLDLERSSIEANEKIHAIVGVID